MQIDYTTVLKATRLLAAAAYEVKLSDEPDNQMDGAEAFIEESAATLLRMIEALNYDDIVGDGQLTGPAMNVAMLEGWCMITDQNGDNVEIQSDDDSDDFDTDEAATAFVTARAESREPGTKLHQIALNLVRRGVVLQPQKEHA